MIRSALLCSLVVITFAGCGGSGYAPVSGIVKVNGQPYGKAVVTFQPIGTTENPNPGRGSSAYTDDTGRYVLVGDKPGAVVGKHLVRIMTKGNDVVTQSADGTSADGGPAVLAGKKVDPIPAEWNSASTKEFVVPAGGTDKADFDIFSKK
ncbi:hypothetical protein NA78x_002234 [Anatilimnocola sp. NA78]|uniref:hypothetical protein n=1 Tax=Anatilimnocola sp. NA78 TaxID=3415683 RepID=UPI003CE5BCA2